MENVGEASKRITPPRTLPNQLEEFSFPPGFESRGSAPFSPTSPGGRSPGRPRTMKEYEEDLTSLKKENFNLKVRIYFLEQHPNLPRDVRELRQLYTSLKVEHDLQKKDLDSKENLLIDTFNALDVQKQELEVLKEENQELRCKIENLEKELKDYHQRFMETSVPQLDDTNALYSMTFGLHARAAPPAPVAGDTLAEEKIRELQEDLAREKEHVQMLKDEMAALNGKQADEQNNVQKLMTQLQETEETLKKIVEERDRYEELYSQNSMLTARLEKSIKKRNDMLKEKDAESEKFKSLATELRKQLTKVEGQLQEIEERKSKSQTSEKQLKMLYAENEKLTQELKLLQQSSRSFDQESQQAKLLNELQTLRSKHKSSQRFIQTIYLENKRLRAQVDELKETVRKVSGAPAAETTKEEVS